MFIVQNIHMSWSRKFRLEDIIKDHKIPEMRKIDTDSLDLKPDHYYIQDICFDEWNNFKEYTYMRSGVINSCIPLSCLKFIERDDELKVFYEHRPELIGEPVREHSKCQMELFTLKPQKWGQVKFNGRITCMDSGNLLCHQQIFNIAFLKGKSEIFKIPPSYQYEDMADLCSQ